ncbi:hypothetical protein RvY_04356 [Ramazzottius varieornatus]|uniref:Uncharacterized protein n=1 Tax=Ramazzottius varieornatus TaxID=947166 RepID=A0A1D1UX37_RAMVA|nr:hypothetical protein RvY_04356 [Ramazzottius varieornatus]
MENGTKDGIQSFIKKISQMFLKGLPASRVLDELAKSISEEQETQVEVESKMATMECEAECLEKTLAQLQHEHEELKHMEDARTRGHGERSNGPYDSKHLQEDRSRKTKAPSTVQKKKR